jgi:hypothetical protein
MSQLRGGWSATSATYTNDLPAGFRNVSTFQVFQFRASVNFADARNPAGVPRDFKVRLTDGAEAFADALVSSFSQALFFPPGSVGPVPKVVLNTIRIPLSAFAGVNLSDVRSVQFRFDQQASGALLITDLAFADSGGAPGLADLVETAVSNPPATVVQGGGFGVTDTAANQGAAGAGASTTRYYLSIDAFKGGSDILLTGIRSVPPLGVGGSSASSATVTVPASTSPNTYFLLACADDTSVVAESSESNNCRASTTTVQVQGGGSTHINVALAANGGVASASTTFSAAFPTSGANNGDRRGMGWGAGGGWNDATANVFPDWLEVAFAGPQAVDEVDVFTVQDNYGSPIDPTLSTTFTLYGLRDFQVQYWDGAQWLTVPGGTVASNNFVWRQVTFAPITTTRIRVLVTAALASYSRITELEAWGTPVTTTPPTASITAPGEGQTFVAPAAITINATANDSDGTVASVAFYANGGLLGTDTTFPYAFAWTGVPAGTYTLTAVATDNLGATGTSAAVHITVTPPAGRINMALAANGGVATASSTFGGGFPTSGANNGDRRGLAWGAGGGWNDATADVFPDWLEVAFAGPRAVDEVDVFTVQDNYGSPIDPTLSTPFTLYGLRDFQVQYWDGAQWLTVPGGAVTSNSFVWRQVTFAPITTTRVRVLVTNALASYSRITELEAWGAGR